MFIYNFAMKKDSAIEEGLNYFCGGSNKSPPTSHFSFCFYYLATWDIFNFALIVFRDDLLVLLFVHVL